MVELSAERVSSSAFSPATFLYAAMASVAHIHMAISTTRERLHGHTSEVPCKRPSSLRRKSSCFLANTTSSSRVALSSEILDGDACAVGVDGPPSAAVVGVAAARVVPALPDGVVGVWIDGDTMSSSSSAALVYRDCDIDIAKLSLIPHLWLGTTATASSNTTSTRGLEFLRSCSVRESFDRTKKLPTRAHSSCRARQRASAIHAPRPHQ